MTKWIFALMVISNVCFAERIIKNEINCDEIPDTSVCYDVKGQAVLDEVIESAQDCQRTLDACRKWRDKYKNLLDPEHATAISIETIPNDEIKYFEWLNNKWVQFGIVSLVAFGTGIGVGLAF